MDSELEDGSNINNSIGDDENQVEINGEVNTPQENGKHEVIVADDSPLIIEQDGKSDNDEASDEDPISVNNSIKEGTNQIALRKELSSKDVHSIQPIQTDELNDGIKAGDANGEAKGNLGKDGKPIVQRRMSLRTRATPKKYADTEGSNDDDLKDILAAKDPLEIPLGKNSSTVLIRKSPSVAVTVQKTPLKSPVKMTKVTRPPPELIKAPILSKISISPATSVTVVPRSKENNSGNSGYVVVDTQTILKGKNPTQVSNVPASVTVSAVPIPPKPLPKSLPSVASTVNRKSTLSASIPNPSSLPDPFESLGLADDSFIVEAPSFVVPYLIEKSASQNLKKTVESMNPTSSSGNKEDVIVLSEDDSNDSGKKEKEKEEDKSNSYPQTTTTGNALDKSAVKTEVDKTTEKSNSSKEDDYFVGPIGRFFLDIGLSLVQEYVQGDLLRVQKRKVHKGTKITDPSLTINALTKGLDITRTKNDPYRLPLRSCDRCNFKSESFLTMSHHWSLPLPLGYGSTSRHGCHWCSFEAKESHLVAAHIESEHGMKSRVGPDIPAHQCPLCPFEDNVKSKVTRHMMSCQKRFIAGRNLEPPLDWEPPAKIPRMPTRGPRAFPSGMNAPSGLHGYPFASTKGLGLPYHPLLPKSALLNTPGYNSVLPSTGAGQNAYLGSGSPAVHSKSSKVGTMPSQAALAGLRLPAELHVVPGGPQRSTGATGSSQSKTRDYHKQPSNQSSSYLNPSYAVPNNQIYQAIAKSFQLLHGQGSSMSVLPSNLSKNQSTSGNAIDKLKKQSNVNAVSLLPGLVNTSGLTIQSSTTPPVNKVKPNQQPSISITPLPRSSTSALANKPSLSVSPVTPASTNAMSTIGNNTLAAKPGQPLAPGQKGAVVCEICDGSIKDLEQLRHHMQWIHKVKIHPKMIHNRPPLNCQKCQCRFFTDQGLERHLLGSHGLVTSSMQEAANRGQDGGRCPICGKVHQWKLLSHVVKDHGLSLKPAHLSYKCTVCTATFTMYKLFENHVYTAHSVVARKVLDKEKVENKKGSSSLTNTSTTGALRINDEITIIPQTTRHDSSDQNSCRPSRGDKRSRVDIIDLSDDEDNKDGLTLPKSQVTITKVPAPKGYFGKNSRESMSKRSRTDDNDTE